MAKLTRILALLFAFALAPPPNGFATEAGAAPESVATWRRLLEQAIDEPSLRSSLRLFAECRRDGQLPSFVVYGHGVGIWNDRVQFEVASEAAQSLLLALREGGFAELEESYGGRSPLHREPDPDDAAVEVTCRIQLSLGGREKQVVQLEEGEQSPELARLAETLYALVAPSTRSGVQAASLEDGLDKIARGELAAETFSATLHRKPELQATGGGRPAFLLHLDGRRVSVQNFTPGTGYGPTRELELGASEIAELAAALASHGPGRLPANLWAPDYNDLTIAVLNHRIAVQARRFSGMTPTTHGADQVDFDEVARTFALLAARVARDGEVVDDERAASSSMR